jgi:hypothetical protein
MLLSAAFAVDASRINAMHNKAIFSRNNIPLAALIVSLNEKPSGR